MVMTCETLSSLDCPKMYLQLSPDPIRFEPVSRVTSVFFDGTTKEVVSVRGGGTLGVVVQGLRSKEAFCMEYRGNITSLKFSPDHSILAVQRTANSLELLSFSKGEVGLGVVVEVKSSKARLLGFVWAGPDDLVLITTQGVEFYQVSQERVFVRVSRSYSLPGCCWFVWSAECRTLVVATGASGGSSGGNALATASGGGGSGATTVPLHPFHFEAGCSTRMAKCLVDLSPVWESGSTSSTAAPAALSERDVCVAFVYRPAICVLKHPTQPSPQPSSPPQQKQQHAQLLVYTNLKEPRDSGSGFRLSHVCELGLSGSFAVNIIDSLIVVHHQASKMSMVFDIALGTEMRNGVCHVYPATAPAPIRPYWLEEPSVTATKPTDVGLSSSKKTVVGSGSSSSAGSSITSVSSTSITSTSGSVLAPRPPPPATNRIPCQLYAPTWVVFQPSVIIDARLGCLWTLQLDLPAFCAAFPDPLALTSCLLHRRQAKQLLVHTVRAALRRRSLHVLGPLFDRLNAAYRRHLDASQNAGSSAAGGNGGSYNLTPPTSALLLPPTTPGNVFSNYAPAIVLEPVDMYTNVLAPLMEEAQELGKHTSSKNNTSDENTSVDSANADAVSELAASMTTASIATASSPAASKTTDSVATDITAESGERENTNMVAEDATKEDRKSMQEQDDERINSKREIIGLSPEAKNEVLYLVSCILEYMRSLAAAGLPAPAFLHQLIVNSLLHAACFHHLHQLLQYHVIPDSKPLACVLLSRAGVYRACEQLCLDMLARLHTAHEEIIEVLLARGHVAMALRYARGNGLEDGLSCRKFLDAAAASPPAVFYATFCFFRRRNARLRGSAAFVEGEHCHQYVQHYTKLFGDPPDCSAAAATAATLSA